MVVIAMINPVQTRQFRNLSGILLALFLSAITVKVLAHAGHGDEFSSGESGTTSVNAIQIDDTTAERIGLKVEPVTRQALTFGIRATGQIENTPSHKVEVTNPVGGKVIKLLVEPGQQVKAGQSLAVMTSGELAELRITALENNADRQGDLLQAQSQLRLAQQNYERYQQIANQTIAQAKTELRVAQEKYDRDKELAAQGAIAKRTFLESEAHLAVARREVTEAESQLAVLAAKTALEQAKTSLQVAQSRAQLSAGTYNSRLKQLGADANADGTITIKAPISGAIAERPVSLGQAMQDAGQTLMTIVDDQTVLATANIYAKDLAQIAVDQGVRVTVAGLPNQIFEGKITTIGTVVEGENRIVPVKAVIANDNGSLKAGMFAELEVITERMPEPAIAIPQSAIIEANGQSLVFVQNGTQFQPVTVTLGQRAGNLVEVTQGLFEGDRLVTQRANQLYAQSLRAKPTEAHSSDTPEAITPEQSLPWWAMVLGGGAIGITTFSAGLWWAKRRSPSLPVTHQPQRDHDSETQVVTLIAEPIPEPQKPPHH